MKIQDNFSKVGHLRPCRHHLQLFAAQTIGKGKFNEKKKIITTKIFTGQMFDEA